MRPLAEVRNDVDSAIIASLVAERDALKAQNAELLAALDQIDLTEDLFSAHKIARAAIAKAGGK